MKSPTPKTPAFTLIELLVVIAIIGILAALLMPAALRMKSAARIRTAKIEITEIDHAIHAYESDYNGFPVSSKALKARPDGAEFTYGTEGVNCASPGSAAPLPLGVGFARPGGSAPYPILAIGGVPAVPLDYQTNNSEIMAILLDLEYMSLSSGSNIPTINVGHVKNPQRAKYLNVRFSGDTASPGVGTDLVYRDPWNNPYIISFDRNGDGLTRDSFYGLQIVSQIKKGSNRGFDGIYQPHDSNGEDDYYVSPRTVMVWSAGPDRMVDPTVNAKTGVNADNVLSWR
jgi:prepilin-type N-terminal cleavage/methylation domain-containing protein